MLYIDTWHVQGWLTSPKTYLMTSYGHKTRDTAEEVAQHMRLFCYKIEVRHTWKQTKRSRWQHETFTWTQSASVASQSVGPAEVVS